MRRISGFINRLLGRHCSRQEECNPKGLHPLNDSSNRLQQLINSARASPGQLSGTEYGFVMALVFRSAPCNILIFGLGRDSHLWQYLNPGGRTVFLEDNKDWFREVPGAECYLVKYPSFTLPETVNYNEWDLVIVDGPAGWKPEHPGRSESIQAAALLVRRPGGIVCIHDYDRPVEQEHCTKHFGNPAIAFDRMAVIVAGVHKPPANGSKLPG